MNKDALPCYPQYTLCRIAFIVVRDNSLCFLYSLPHLPKSIILPTLIQNFQKAQSSQTKKPTVSQNVYNHRKRVNNLRARSSSHYLMHGEEKSVHPQNLPP
jgi:hypothetical protein